MNVARIAVIAIALIAGLIAMVLARSMGGSKAPQPVQVVEQKPQMELVQVLTAKAPIPAGTILNAEHLAWVNWPAKSAAIGYVTKASKPAAINDYSGTVTRASFLSGEPIKEGKLAMAGKGYMSAILPKGKRAVATRISAATGAGGFILPNDHVDVILTEDNDKGVSSETILSNIRVLAIDQRIEQVPQEGEGSQPKTVVVGETATLELLPFQSEILATAQRMGKLSLVLRSLEDVAGDDADVEQNSGTIVMVRSGVISKKTVKQVSGQKE